MSSPSTQDTSAPAISVVIPFYNEEANVEPLFDELVPILDGMGRSWEVVCVDDGSRDATLPRLRQAARRWGRVHVLSFTGNNGQTAAFDAGFRAARGELVVTLDGDLQIDPRDIPLMVARLEETGVDFVYGWRKDRRDDFLKRVSTKIANGVRNRLTRETIRDTGCPLKVFRAEVVRSFQLFEGMHRFFITLAHMRGFRSAEQAVRHRPRTRGESKYGIRNRVFRALRDCLSVRWMMRRHLRYQVATDEVAAGEPTSGNPGSPQRAVAGAPEAAKSRAQHDAQGQEQKR